MDRRRAVIAVVFVFVVVMAGVVWWLGTHDAPTSSPCGVRSAVDRADQAHGGLGPIRQEDDVLPATNTASESTQPPPEKDGSRPTTSGVTDPEAAAEAKPRPSVIAPSAPVLDWSLRKADYERILIDPNATEEQKVEARLRLDLRLWDRPGRNANRLGGFHFDPKSYRELDAFELQTVPEWASAPTVHITGNPPYVMLQKRFAFNKSPSRLGIKISVFPSIDAAQRHFLPTDDFAIGDMCRRDKDGPQATTSVAFVRHNVLINLDLTAIPDKGTPVLVDVVGFAMKVDKEIQAQSRPATDWADLAAYCPTIDEFSFVEQQLPTADGKLQSKVNCVARHPDGKPIYYEWKAEPAVSPRGTLGVNPGKPSSASIHPDGYEYEERPYKAWVVVCDDAMLFSMAEASIMVRPPKSK